jgi:hypothetical protein
MGKVGGQPGAVSAAPEAAVAPGVEYSAGGLAMLPPFVPLHGLARWTTRLVATSGALAALSLGVELNQLRLLLQPIEGEAARQLARAAQSATGGVLGLARAAVLAATAALFLAWVHQARTNVRALGVRRPRFSSGRALAAFLVPGLNLVRPPAVMAELWQASDPSILDPFGWRGAPVARLVPSWWWVFVVWALLASVALFVDATAGVALGRLRLATGLGAVADALCGVAAALAWQLVARLSDAQQRKWERLRAERGSRYAMPRAESSG